MSGHSCEAGLVKLGPRAQMEVAKCGQPATGFFAYGCVHEHVVQKWTCEEHHPRPGWVGCVQCLKAGHECEMTFREIPAGLAGQT